MTAIKILDNYVDIESKEFVKVLNLKLHEFLSWINISHNKSNPKFKNDYVKVITILTDNNIIFRPSKGQPWQRNPNVSRNLILAKGNLVSPIKVKISSKPFFSIKDHDEWINGYADSSWTHNDVLLGLPRAVQ